jgi:hypothetical protein
MQDFRVGIFGLTKESAERKLKLVVDEFDKELIKLREKDRVVLKDGGSFTACGAESQVRGRRNNLIYVDTRLKDTLILKEVILPSLMPKRSLVGVDGLNYYVENMNWDARYYIRWF